jgi:crotonobetainyl-CoA:carnitine CoA-transferase CaiB-like acyl-CoA transferase
MDLPLENIRVIDLCDGKAEMCGRLLADLGAEVILVEPPGGMLSRQRAPLYQGVSLHFATHNANKRSVCLDLETEQGKSGLLDLTAGANIVVESGKPGTLERLGLSAERMRAGNEQLIVLCISEFGQWGPYRDFEASNAVHLALAGVLARSGIYGHEPLLPPGDMAVEAAAVQAAWVALLACIRQRKNGMGDYLDFSLFEATAQLIDPGLGVTGSAAGGKTAAQLAQRGRPPVSPFYPIFPCQDGFVRLCILNPRQWQGMSTWLGKDHPFTDPAYGSLNKRAKVIKEINLLIARLFAQQKGEYLVEEGQKLGIPIARLETPQEVLADSHFAARGAFVPLQLDNGKSAMVPSGYLEIDGARIGTRNPAPAPGEDNRRLLATTREPGPAGGDTTGIHRPLDGIRVLDLGVIVAGAELGRLLSDQGAQVIKIENEAFPDGLRQSHQGHPITHSFAQGSRGKLSFGLNLRSDNGIAIFKQLVAISDVVLSNFKPGTLESLGIGYDTLKQINPGIIMADSSALGSSGPRSRTMGYGPLVRASTGISGLWRYPDMEDGGFSDGITIYPDHFAARVSAVGIAALLIRREQTGQGGTVSVAQAECILNSMATMFCEESLVPGSMKPLGNHNAHDAPNSLFPCAGTDQWCLVAVRNDAEWENLCTAIGCPEMAAEDKYSSAAGRLRHRQELEARVSDWTRGHSADAVMSIMQSHAVPAGKMFRIEEVESNPHLQKRGFIRELVQPGIEEPMATENGPVIASNLPDPDIRPAPFLGQHTRMIARELLGFDDEKIETLISAGDLETA